MQRNTDSVYYNHSGYHDPTAGRAIANADKGHSFYKSRAWKRSQKSFMVSRCYVCERCGGVGTLAHHKVYITPENISDPKITLSWSNLECLCMPCHNREHMTSDVTAPGITFDATGQLVYTPPVV